MHRIKYVKYVSWDQSIIGVKKIVQNILFLFWLLLKISQIRQVKLKSQIQSQKSFCAGNESNIFRKISANIWTKRNQFYNRIQNLLY